MFIQDSRGDLFQLSTMVAQWATLREFGDTVRRYALRYGWATGNRRSPNTGHGLN